jgi:hypothetical protein
MTIAEANRRVQSAISGFNSEIDNIFKEYEPELSDMQRERIFEGKYIDNTNISPGYTPLTIKIKTAKNQPTDRVTLKDTGDFHEAIFARKEGDFLLINSTDEKTNSLTTKYGEIIFGLTEENKVVSNKYVMLQLIKYIKNITRF